MKFLALTMAALASVAAAGWECKPATYACTFENGKYGWKVCNTSGKWVVGGHCRDTQYCELNEDNGSPYCLP
ncbi:hypothetical protein L249_0986 [Ophiocordyceps polyrhachis-furcata BCC 54312]|uniref:Uncharacterized protein n=1 Tax=Ophiocordyceps polyrhachis-furcata BCC 54312 TaxID=1330021 RepID=A0A367LDD7_9HYPO|nr:hypothetical protein L249_0986 [Ophiocordyceps polyrhachis-furcata BCC 54312]